MEGVQRQPAVVTFPSEAWLMFIAQCWLSQEGKVASFQIQGSRAQGLGPQCGGQDCGVSSVSVMVQSPSCSASGSWVGGRGWWCRVGAQAPLPPVPLSLGPVSKACPPGLAEASLSLSNAPRGSSGLQLCVHA